MIEADKIYPVYTGEPREFVVALDSGAHSLYSMKFAGAIGEKGQFSRTHSSYEFAESQEFKDYLDDYIKFVLEHKEKMRFYVTLDIIFNPEKSWEITKYIESYGLHPIPVYHYGEDPYWLKKMMDEYEYLGIGGLGQDVTKERFIPWGDECFKLICDEHGTPRVKVHGFAMNSPDLLTRYPWYSCDASTWTALSRNGTVYLPKPILKGKEVIGYDYLIPPYSLPVTQRRENLAKHHNNHSPTYRATVSEYFSRFGLDDDYVCNEYHPRDILNINYLQRLQDECKRALDEHHGYGIGGNLFLAGTPSGASTNLRRVVDLIYDLKEPSTNWLGSYYYIRHALNLLRLSDWKLQDKVFRDLQATLIQRAPYKKGPKMNPNSIPRVPLPINKPPAKVEVQISYKYAYTVDGKHFAGVPAEQREQKEKQFILDHLINQISALTPDVQITVTDMEKEPSGSNRPNPTYTATHIEHSSTEFYNGNGENGLPKNIDDNIINILSDHNHYDMPNHTSVTNVDELIELDNGSEERTIENGTSSDLSAAILDSDDTTSLVETIDNAPLEQEEFDQVCNILTELNDDLEEVESAPIPPRTKIKPRPVTVKTELKGFF